MTSPHTDRPPLLTTLLQSFFIVPFWDAQNLIKIVQSGNLELRHRLTEFGGALLAALIGWWVLRWLLPGDCCQVSTALYPGESVGTLIWPRLITSFGMLAFIALGGLIITGLLIGLSTISWRLASLSAAGRVLNTLRWEVVSLLASPPGHLSIVAVLLAGIRFGLHLVPVRHSAAGLIIPGCIVALLPALIAARRVEQDTSDPLIYPEWSIMLAGKTFYRQASWLVGGLAFVEAVFGVDGLGKLLVDALRAGDGPLILPLLLLFMVATALCRLHVIRLEVASTSAPHELTNSFVDSTIRCFRWVVLCIVLIIPLAFPLNKGSWLPFEPTAVYATPSAHHPWGTNEFGQDIQTLARSAFRNGWLIALTGGLVSTGLGGLWAFGIAWLREIGHRFLADGLSALAESLILFAPGPLALWFLLHSYGPTLSVVALGALSGVVLIPRMVWDMVVTKHATLRPEDLLKRMVAHLVTGGFVAFQMTLMAALIVGRGVASPSTPGGLLSAYQDMLGGASLLNGGPYLRLALILALPGLVLAWGWYMLTDALTNLRTPDGSANLLG